MKQISIRPLTEPESTDDVMQIFVGIDDSSDAKVVDVVGSSLVIEHFQKDNFGSQVEVRLSRFHAPVESEPEKLVSTIDDGFRFLRIISFEEGGTYALSVPE